MAEKIKMIISYECFNIANGECIHIESTSLLIFRV